ncbi:3R [Xanthomonas phage Xp10]|uniref:3R n=1 Tax=Xanthomonas phage Xp10 TaxID=2907956 RepID=Q7Y5L4_9CAUD|nr:endonuclease of the HNH family [Xanthomonas phage Xp10]AAP58670.1 3R [Xanthomonas phage Xp10]
MVRMFHKLTNKEILQMAKNDLTFEDVDKLLAYEPETGLLRWKVAKAIRIKVGDVAGCVNGDGYPRVCLHGRQYQAHRLAWLLHTGSWPSKHLDHISGQRDDNRIVNLRECSHAENHQNRGKNKNNTSGIQGVSWHKLRKKWMARIRVGGASTST